MIVEEVFPSDNGLDNENCSRPRSAILSFACKIPSTMSTVPRDPDDLRVAKPVAILSRDVLNVGIVGTITLLGNSSAMIWFGWGRIDEVALEDNKDESSSAIKSTGTSGLCKSL